MFDGFVNGAKDLTKHASYDEGYQIWLEQHRATESDVKSDITKRQAWKSTEKPSSRGYLVVFRLPVEYYNSSLLTV